MHRASSRVLATTTSHVARRWRPGLSVPHALGSPLQRTFAAVAITPIDGFAEVASSAETTTRDGSKDKPEEEWQKMVEDGKLTPQSYMVLRRKATEPGHAVRVANGGFDDLEEDGVYVCAGCSQPLFTSQMKFDCGCGWPGFWGIIPNAIYEERDADGFRVEILCNGCNGHVGHVFRGEAGTTEERRCTYNGQVFGH